MHDFEATRPVKSTKMPSRNPPIHEWRLKREREAMPYRFDAHIRWRLSRSIKEHQGAMWQRGVLEVHIAIG